MKNYKKIYTKYCSGCGLCKSINQVKFVDDNKGFNYPQLSDKDIEFCQKVCPASGASEREMDFNQIWGKYKNVYLGWSLNKDIRYHASSGGIITSLCCYLLDKHIVDGIIQVKADNTVPYATKIIISRTSKEVIECMGSRYSISSPLNDFIQMLDSNQKYAFVGKPCDVSALRMYLNTDPKSKNMIKYIFSFFCAGEPSEDAQKRLLSSLDCNEKNCTKLTYRGNGWPGFTTALKEDGTTSEITYVDSWGKILGRDIRRVCRFCLDGIGELADVSCGDAWYLTDENKPDFSENKGRNVIFGRTDRGDNLIKDAFSNGYITIEEYENKLDELYYIQTYQYTRRTTMIGKIMAMKLLFKDVPKYKIGNLLKYAKKEKMSTHLRIFLGTLKRGLQGKLD